MPIPPKATKFDKVTHVHMWGSSVLLGGQPCHRPKGGS